MYIFLIYQTDNDDYDTYDAAIVIAPDAEWARMMHPAGSEKYPEDDPWLEYHNKRCWVSSPDKVGVKMIGEYIPTPAEEEHLDELQPRFILKSFHSG